MYAAYAGVLTEANMESMIKKRLLSITKQKQDDWQSADVITVGDRPFGKEEGDTDNWIGKPGAGGTCGFRLTSRNQICGQGMELLHQIAMTW